MPVAPGAGCIAAIAAMPAHTHTHVYPSLSLSMFAPWVAAGVVSCYVHMPVTPGAGRIAAVVGLEAAGAQQLAQVRAMFADAASSF